ncbi:hypothetical protein [Leptospira interrogans]|uniref:hypothetical protein n=1 Tax=Leptospira interrogans TaxID=173 RepID=UPI000347B9BD|nr:hypothetical protein [Leptospira interrogans]QCO31837.1 hypothetical protein E4414_00955 [Leptospira interrogans]QCO42346.1 hypothetical protein E4413_16730 [Leptospira interrogans]UMQ53638.1 hypothetical protein FH582_17170 [Leptospira interrogans]
MIYFYHKVLFGFVGTTTFLKSVNLIQHERIDTSGTQQNDFSNSASCFLNPVRRFLNADS